MKLQGHAGCVVSSYAVCPSLMLGRCQSWLLGFPGLEIDVRWQCCCWWHLTGPAEEVSAFGGIAGVLADVSELHHCKVSCDPYVLRRLSCELLGPTYNM